MNCFISDVNMHGTHLKLFPVCKHFTDKVTDSLGWNFKYYNNIFLDTTIGMNQFVHASLMLCICNWNWSSECEHDLSICLGWIVCVYSPFPPPDSTNIHTGVTIYCSHSSIKVSWWTTFHHQEFNHSTFLLRCHHFTVCATFCCVRASYFKQTLLHVSIVTSLKIILTLVPHILVHFCFIVMVLETKLLNPLSYLYVW